MTIAGAVIALLVASAVIGLIIDALLEDDSHPGFADMQEPS